MLQDRRSGNSSIDPHVNTNVLALSLSESSKPLREASHVFFSNTFFIYVFEDALDTAYNDNDNDSKVIATNHDDNYNDNYNDDIVDDI